MIKRLAVVVFALVFLVPAYAYAAVIVEDPFTEASDTNLVDHVPNTTGTGWTEEEVTGSPLRIQRVFAANDEVGSDGFETSARHIYTAQPNPSVVEYDLEAKITGIGTSDDDPWFLVARFTGTGDYYSAGTYRFSVGQKIFKKVGGTKTELASATNTFSVNDVLKFEIKDATKKLFLAGAEILSTSDNALTSAGRAGFGLGNAWVSGNDINPDWKADDFKVTETGVAVITRSFGVIVNRAIQWVWP